MDAWTEVEPGILEGLYWLNDDCFYEYVEELLGEHYSQELADKIGKPFYEVELKVRLHMDSGRIEILRASH